MIHLVDQAMERLLRAEGPLAEDVAEISFKPPDKTWSAGVNRPTLNLFLYDVHRDPRLAASGIEEQRDGQEVERRPASPVVTLRYVVTAWANEPRDEHQLLGTALRCMLANKMVPDEYLGDGLSSRAGYLSITVGMDNRKPGDVAPALDGRVRASFELELAVPVDAYDWVEAGPPTQTISVDVERKPAPSVIPEEKKPVATTRRRGKNGSLLMEGRPDSADQSD